MKHGVAFRKFSRTTSHRMLMLRNLVTSLLEHEQIKTTLPKARDTARLAEKIITLGKKGTLPAYRRAHGFVLKPAVLPKLFQTLAERYASRPGGYTRIHKFGNRPGDNAPTAILELVDNPRDLKFDMTARAVGWELLGKRLGSEGLRPLQETGLTDVKEVVEKEHAKSPEQRGELRPKTRWNLQKVLKFRNPLALTQLATKAEDHADTLLAQPIGLKMLLQEKEEQRSKAEAPLTNAKALRLKAGQTLPGGARSALRLAQGALGKEPAGRLRWFERRKLGVDKTPLWTQA
ncbi:mitochondrial ribosomal protein L17 [Obba rivulosa]|uniref:Mitochondrial ribosomal protein L17 n=1 Tax=Obba rivulosa TaxID=1052685 RepID=A0A8E2DUH7_9APHY|nr:mitochondrial ribosomal protein L17 [Obba rivulosa]